MINSKSNRRASRRDCASPTTRYAIVLVYGDVLTIKMQTLEVRYGSDENSARVTQGRTALVNGKSAQIKVNGHIRESAQILGIATIGREDPTSAEKESEAIILEILQGTMSYFSLPIVQKILRDVSSNVTRSLNMPIRAVDLAGRPLNNSQATAVHRITSADPDDQVVLVHGPPGTGKTTVIATSVIELVNSGQSRGIWLIAQSNIAVKNIAEKLADVDFLDFKVLVSMDFHFEWYAVDFHMRLPSVSGNLYELMRLL